MSFRTLVFLGLCGVLAWGVPGSAQAKVYKVGVFMGLGGTQDVQGSEILRTMTRVFTSRLKMKTNYVVFTDEKKFITEIRKGKLDMAFTTRWDVFFGEILGSGHRPVVTLNYFGKNEIPNCLYVQADSPYKSVKDLKGKRVATYTSQTEYFTLRNFIGAGPETYFAPLVPFPNSISGLYQLGLGTTDAAFVNRGVYQFLSLTNPGVGKQLRALGCGQGYYSPPFTMAKTIDAAKEKKVIEILKNLPKDPAFANLRPLSRGMNASFITVTKNNYLPLIQLRKKAYSLNWHIDHKNWLYSVQGLNEKIRTSN